jgi:hypothetical protein
MIRVLSRRTALHGRTVLRVWEGDDLLKGSPLLEIMNRGEMAAKQEERTFNCSP